MAWFSRTDTPALEADTQMTRVTASLARDADSVVTAAVGPMRNVEAKGWFGGSSGDVKAKQEQVLHYDKNGPGFVGFYLDLYSTLAAEFPLVIQEYVDGRWQLAQGGRPGELLAEIKGVGEDQKQFHQANCRAFKAVGEVAFWPNANGHANGWHRDLPHTIKSHGKHPTMKGRPNVYLCESSPGVAKEYKPDAAPPSGLHVVPYAQMRRVWAPDTEYSSLPTSSLFRILSDIRRYETFNRNVQRSGTAALLLAGLLWIEGDAKDVVGSPSPMAQSSAEAALGPLGKQIRSLMKAAQRNVDDTDERQVASAMAHPFVYKTKPERVEIGKAVDPGMLQAKADALADAARGVDGPMSAIVEGQGAAQRLLNEWKQDSAINQAALSLSARVALSYGPALLDPRLTDEERGRFRVFVDESALDNEETDSSEDLSLWEKGVITRDALARRRGVDPADMLPLPDGVTDYEHWLASTGSRDVVDNEVADAPVTPAAPEDGATVASASPWWDQWPK